MSHFTPRHGAARTVNTVNTHQQTTGGGVLAYSGDFVTQKFGNLGVEVWDSLLWTICSVNPVDAVI